MFRNRIGVVITLLILVTLACSSATNGTPTPLAQGVTDTPKINQPVADLPSTPEANPVLSTPITKIAPTATAPTQQTIGKVGDRVESSGIALTVVNVQKLAKAGLANAKEGNVILDIEVVIENQGKDDVPYNPLYFKVKDSDNYEYDMAFGSLEPSLKSGDLKPGDMARGHVAFEIPEKAIGLIVSYEPMVLFGGYKAIQVNLDEVSDNPAELKTAAAPAPNGKVGERIESGGMALIIVKTDALKKAGFATAKPGNVILDVEVLIQNVSRDDPVPYNPMYFKVKDSSGFEYNTGFGSVEPSLKSGNLEKGDVARGHVGFEVPEKTTGLILSYEPQVLFSNYKVIQVDLGSKADKLADLPKALAFTASKIGTPVESAGISVSVIKVQKVKKAGFSSAKEGFTILDIDVLIKNTNRTEDTPYNPLYFIVKDADGFEYSTNMTSLEPSLKSGDLKKGEEARGHVAFEVPENATGLVISYEPQVIFGGYQATRIGLP